MGRLLRLVLCLTASLCVWLWVGTARAQSFEAPRCDGRGATTFAPAPTLQPLLYSLRVSPPADESCSAAEDGATCSQNRHRTPSQPPVHADPAGPDPRAVPRVEPAAPNGSLDAPPVDGIALPAHTRLPDRPPR